VKQTGDQETISFVFFQQRLKAAFAAQSREMKKKKSFDKVKDTSPSDVHQVVSCSLFLPLLTPLFLRNMLP
jgi:hypothetical protein